MEIAMSYRRYCSPEADPVARAAQALFECDEDMTDERIADRMAAGDRSWQTAASRRECWATQATDIQHAYMRRARAALAAAAYPAKSPG